MKTLCHPGSHHNGFVATHALGGHHTVHHVPKCMGCHKAIVLIYNINQSAQISQKQNERNIIYIYIYIYICNYENNVPSQLSQQWLCGNSGTWVHDVRLHVVGSNELKSAQQAKQVA